MVRMSTGTVCNSNSVVRRFSMIKRDGPGCILTPRIVPDNPDSLRSTPVHIRYDRTSTGKVCDGPYVYRGDTGPVGSSTGIIRSFTVVIPCWYVVLPG